MGVDDVERVLRLLAHERPLPDGIEGLDAFTLALIGHWDEARHPAAGRWVLAAAGNAGARASAGKLAGFARAWPSARAFHALNALRANGALMHLDALTRTARKPQVRERADELLDAVAADAASRATSWATTPCRTAGSTRTARAASRSTAACSRSPLGPELKPMLRDEKRQAARDAAEAVGGVEGAAQAGRRCRASCRPARLEQAMVTQRRWSVDGLRALDRPPPAAAPSRADARVARRRRPFRITDELDYADIGDRPVTLTGRVAIAHPLRSERGRRRWGELSADYGLVPPFPQLARPVLDVDPSERDGTDVARVQGVWPTPTGTLASTTSVRLLERLGWERGFTGRRRRSSTLRQDLTRAHGAMTVVAAVRAWGSTPATSDLDEQTPEQICVLDVIVAYALDVGREDLPLKRVVWGDVDPIVRSEVLADIHAILEKARG